MENKNIILLRHHPMNVHFTNTFYINQLDDTDDLSTYEIFDVTSRCERDKEFIKKHPTFAKDLSPFYIGPVIGPDGARANVFEIFWQCGKVYPCHDNKGKPNEDFFTWRKSFYEKEVCSKDLMRHSCKDLGYEHKDTLYFAYFDKEINDYVPLDYVESRKKVYFKEYAKLIVNTESYRYLKQLVDRNIKIALVDFDCFNYYSDKAKQLRFVSKQNEWKKNKQEPNATLEDFMNINSIKEFVKCKFLAAGHSLVIKALLQGDLEVKNGEVIDHANILD